MKRIHRKPANFFRPTLTEHVIIACLLASGVAGVCLVYGPELLKAIVTAV